MTKSTDEPKFASGIAVAPAPDAAVAVNAGALAALVEAAGKYVDDDEQLAAALVPFQG